MAGGAKPESPGLSRRHGWQTLVRTARPGMEYNMVEHDMAIDGMETLEGLQIGFRNL
ncbi:hypothetical protein [Robiginitalea marina]|uniref:Uncharacterized protein n=1 Tax=Robiginitalea marina TaxID=2954105 RepID=A0ABT1AUL4_9FLAO|nr:hypothetical protein [Robiginitalea marina]MCO5723262.1 hypothetical protein [Robiginitalea marina]